MRVVCHYCGSAGKILEGECLHGPYCSCPGRWEVCPSCEGRSAYELCERCTDDPVDAKDGRYCSGCLGEMARDDEIAHEMAHGCEVAR